MSSTIRLFQTASFILVILILNINVSKADLSTITGKVSMEILNSPPAITYISIVPELAYEGDILECIVKIADQHAESVIIEYKWYVNNYLVSQDSKLLEGFKRDDSVFCKAKPTDREGAVGETKTFFITIGKKPLTKTITGFAAYDVVSDKGLRTKFLFNTSILLLGLSLFI
jgi:hypothetical protein